MPEKLLTIGEVAIYLKLSEGEVKRLVDIGEIPAYKIGDTFLRFRKEQIDAIRSEITEFEMAEPEGSKAVPEINPAEPRKVYVDHSYTFLEKVRDFFYFYDFYILSFIIIAVLLYTIFSSKI